jgi:uncharacterized DUF497 family protein
MHPAVAGCSELALALDVAPRSSQAPTRWRGTFLALGYQFEWDTEKAAANLRKHGVSFDEATSVFGDPLAILKPDPDHSADEQCFILLGASRVGIGRLLVVSIAERGSRTHLISARRATRRERQQYEQDA